MKPVPFYSTFLTNSDRGISKASVILDKSIPIHSKLPAVYYPLGFSWNILDHDELLFLILICTSKLMPFLAACQTSSPKTSFKTGAERIR